MESGGLTTRIFADGADLNSILEYSLDPRISGFTTNPTLMRQAGLGEYEEFAHQLLGKVTEHPVSFEVLADEPEEIRRQARTIAGWAENVYVKVPVTTTSGEPLAGLAGALSGSGVKVNVTAVFTRRQIDTVTEALRDGGPSYVSVFAGRIADAGVDPLPIMAHAMAATADLSDTEVIWASPREVLNLVQAGGVGCDIITMTPDLLKKLDNLGKDLEQFSLETVQMFRRDALAAGLTL